MLGTEKYVQPLLVRFLGVTYIPDRYIGTIPIYLYYLPILVYYQNTYTISTDFSRNFEDCQQRA